VLLVGFAVLPLRAMLYTLSDDSAWLVAVQLLDGVGAGVWGVLAPLVVADLMRGTGRYNLALGAVATAQGVGASLSGVATGLIADRFGYDAAFAASTGVALSALAVLGAALRETLDRISVVPPAASEQRRAGCPTESGQALRG
jgi:MFS family permease